MAMEKVWTQINERLDRIEAVLKELQEQPKATTVNVTKQDLTKIKGVGDALADEILKAMRR